MKSLTSVMYYKARELALMNWMKLFISSGNLINKIHFWVSFVSVASRLHKTLLTIAYTRASYQIRKIAGCACAGNTGNVVPPPRVSNPDIHHDVCMTHVSWCMPGSLTNGCLWSQCHGVGENVPGIPSACTTRNFTHLVRGSCVENDNIIRVISSFKILKESHLAQWLLHDNPKRQRTPILYSLAFFFYGVYIHKW